MMCGLPFAQRKPRPTLVAAPVPSPPRYGGRPVYCTDIVVAADSPHRTIEDTFGGVVGYTLADSMSGAVALRDHLLPLRASAARGSIAAAVGGLVNARGVIDALAAGRIDVGPLDSYSHDLLQALRAAARRAACARSRAPDARRSRRSSRRRRSAPTRSRACAPRSSPRRVRASSLRRWRDLRSPASPSPEPSAYDALAAIADASTLAFEDL